MRPPRRRPPTLPRSRRASSLSRRFARRSSGDFRDGARLFCRPKRSASLTAAPRPHHLLLDALRMGRIIRDSVGAGSIFTSNTSDVRVLLSTARRYVRGSHRLPLPRVIGLSLIGKSGTSLTLPSPFLPPQDYAEHHGYTKGVVTDIIHDPGRGAPLAKVRVARRPPPVPGARRNRTRARAFAPEPSRRRAGGKKRCTTAPVRAAPLLPPLSSSPAPRRTAPPPPSLTSPDLSRPLPPNHEPPGDVPQLEALPAPEGALRGGGGDVHGAVSLRGEEGAARGGQHPPRGQHARGVHDRHRQRSRRPRQGFRRVLHPHPAQPRHRLRIKPLGSKKTIRPGRRATVGDRGGGRGDKPAPAAPTTTSSRRRATAGPRCAAWR